MPTEEVDTPMFSLTLPTGLGLRVAEQDQKGYSPAFQVFLGLDLLAQGGRPLKDATIFLLRAFHAGRAKECPVGSELDNLCALVLAVSALEALEAVAVKLGCPSDVLSRCRFNFTVVRGLPVLTSISIQDETGAWATYDVPDTCVVEDVDAKSA